MNKLRRRYPAFFDNLQETEHEFDTLEKMLAINWVKDVAQCKGFYRFSTIKVEDETGSYGLMAEVDEGKRYFVVGWLTLEQPIDLPEWTKQECSAT